MTLRSRRSATTGPLAVVRQGLLAAGDPDGQVQEAWMVKELLRELYTPWGVASGRAQ